MAIYTWSTSTTSSTWADRNNWTVGGSPAADYPGHNNNNSHDQVVIGTNSNNVYPLIQASIVSISKLTVDSGASLTIAAQSNHSRSLTVDGNGVTGYDVINNGTITLTGYSSSNTAGLTVSGSGGLSNSGTISSSSYASLYVGATHAIANTGTIHVTGGTLTVTGLITDTGSSAITIDSGATLTTSQLITNTAGTITLNGGTLSDTGGLVLTAGSLTGYGVVNLNTGNLTGGGTLVATGGTLTVTAHIDTVTGTAATSFEIGDGYTLSLASTSAVGIANSIQPTLKFDGANGGTFSDTAATFGTVHLGDISGFSGTDKIVLKSYSTTTGGDTYSITGNTLTITNGSNSESFTFASGTDMSHINVVDGGANDTIYFCFMTGTLVRTPDGEVAVETLKRGDLVLTSEGVAKPVNWLGKQTVSTLFADPVRSLPIRVRAGALAENVPSRDLLVSPDHALLVDGVLIHAGALVNGTSIVRETNVPTVFVYYHVELDDHSLILAENTPAETFVDNVDRMNFDNWAEFEALYPEGKTVEELPFPRAKAHRQVPVYIRVALADRAQVLGARDSAAVA